MKITYNTIDRVFGAKLCDVDTMQLKGYELVEEYFVDSSGWGQDNEPALTREQFINKLTKLLEQYPGGLTAKITGQGMFQVYVGLFKRTGKSKARKVANNTLRIETDRGYKIRLHATDIFETVAHRGGTVYRLNSGGWQTKTTKDRINAHLGDELGAYIYQKNYEWYIRYQQDQDAEPIEYRDNILVYRWNGKLKEYTKSI